MQTSPSSCFFLFRSHDNRLCSSTLRINLSSLFDKNIIYCFIMLCNDSNSRLNSKSCSRFYMHTSVECISFSSFQRYIFGNIAVKNIGIFTSITRIIDRIFITTARGCKKRNTCYQCHCCKLPILFHTQNVLFKLVV